MGLTTVNQAIVDGAEALRQAWKAKIGADIDEQKLTVLCGQVWGESNFGRAVSGWRPIFWGTNNYGAIQATPGWIAAHKGSPGWGYILCGDVHADGTPYVYPYRLYPLQLVAADDYLKLILAYAKMTDMTDPTLFATALRSHGYFEAKLANYIKMIQGGMNLTIRAFAAGLQPADPSVPTGDDFPPNAFDGKHLPGRVTIFGPAPPPPAPPPFDVTHVVGQQAALHYLSIALGNSSLDPGPIDGIKGPHTLAAIKFFQNLTGLVPDGIVGPLTQARLLKEVAEHHP